MHFTFFLLHPTNNNSYNIQQPTTSMEHEKLIFNNKFNIYLKIKPILQYLINAVGVFFFLLEIEMPVMLPMYQYITDPYAFY